MTYYRVLKIVIWFKLTEKPKLPENYQEQTWEKLSEAVIAIQTSRSIKYSLEDLYQAVQNMCNHNMASSTYESLKGNLTLLFYITYDCYNYLNILECTILLLLLSISYISLVMP